MILHTLLWLVVAVLLYMTAWFFVARITDRTDAVDSAWGLGFVYVAWIAWAMNGHVGGVRLWATLFVTIWGVRLFLHIFLRSRKKTEDHRYVAYREKWGDSFWPRAYVSIFLTQGLLLLLISTSTIAIMTSTRSSWAALALLGFVVWIFGIVFEARADMELTKFLKTKQPGQIMQKGLWRFSRHPNYFGEVTAWWGAALVAVSLQSWWGILGAIVITVLITKVSGIPLLEKHYADNPAFQKYKKRTSVFFPLPPKS